MEVSYDLTFIKGSGPFSNLSEIYFRPDSYLEYCLSYFEEVFPGVKVYHVSLQGSLTEMVTALQRELKFPHDTSHSLEAFGDLLCDLSWLQSSHVILIADVSKQRESLSTCMLLDVLTWAVNMTNAEGLIKLSILVLL